MVFINYIKFAHGKLKRGERCLYKGHSATYMGSYVEHDRVVDMLRISIEYEYDGMVGLEEFIEQCEDRKQITCIKQQRQVPENQLQLC